MSSIDRMVKSLQSDGIYVCPDPVLNDVEMTGLTAALMDATQYRSHVAGKTEETVPNYSEAIRAGWSIFAPHMHDLIMAPCWFEVAMSYFGVAQAYFGGKFPYLYSLNAFWSAPAAGDLYQDTQAWHRDGDDPHQLTLFMLGTDVLSLDAGAHLFQRGTHHITDDQLGWPFRQDPPDQSWTELVMGPRGTMIVCDTNALHKAIRPVTTPRLLVWARWSTACPPQSYQWDKLSPLPAAKLGNRYPSDQELQRAINLVVN